jgi:citrate lyase subunit beta / citryl-CoA lyase
MTHTTGNHGEGVRSDCFVRLTVHFRGGVSIDLNSKVSSLYGESIRELSHEILSFFGIKHATLELDDQGALPFTIAARLEAAIKMHLTTDKEYLLPMLPQNQYFTAKDAERVTRLYLPGNSPKLMINAGIYGSHGIILDLEDSVAPDKKAEARFLVRNALRSVDFYRAERMVRINQLPAGLEDLDYCVPHQVNLILIPKCEQVSQIADTEARISEILGRKNDSIHLMPIIESAAGVMHAFEIARASDNIVAMAIGLEDYTADIGVQRTPEGRESFFARSMVIHAARAAGIQPIDSVFSDIDDMEALKRHALESKALGFTGMGCIHPRQVPVINENFMPGEAETDKARKIVAAYEKAAKEGSGVVTLDSKMIDLPVVRRALKTIEKAVNAGRIPENWRDSHEQ